MKFTVSGDLTFPFVIKVDADDEDSAYDKVMTTDPRTLGISFGLDGTGIDIRVDEVMQEDDSNNPDIYIHALRAGKTLRMAKEGTWFMANTEGAYLRGLDQGYQPHILTMVELVVDPSAVNTSAAMAKMIRSFKAPRIVVATGTPIEDPKDE